MGVAGIYDLSVNPANYQSSPFYAFSDMNFIILSITSMQPYFFYWLSFYANLHHQSAVPAAG